MEWLTSLHGQTVGLDTSPLLYFIGGHPSYLGLVRAFFQAVDQGELTTVTSVITLAEVLVYPLRMGYTELVWRYRDVLLHSSGVATLPVSPHVAEEAAQLRADYGLRTPDAIQIATAISVGARTFLTNDKRLAKVSELQMLILDDLLGGK